MNIPVFSEQNFAMHLLGASFVELFPNLQLLDLSVYPDRFCIDFSFSRTLSLQEIMMLKTRFFEKMKGEDRGQIREMVSKNACDLLKHYKQMFLTELVDREEQFTEMLCMQVYQAPIFGEIDLDCKSIKEIKLEMFDLGEKKWMKKRVHHFRMEGFVFHSKEDRAAFEKLEGDGKQDHLSIGQKEGLFWVEDGLVSFSAKGEKEFQKLIIKAENFFGGRVYFETDAEDFSKITGEKDFFVMERAEGQFDGICYGLKETEVTRVLTAFTFSGKNLKNQLENFLNELGVSFQFDQNDRCVVVDFKGIPWVIAEIGEENNYKFIEINLQGLYALQVENLVK